MGSKLLGIGVGPGDSKLITLQALEAIRELDVIFSPQANINKKSLALSIVEEHLPSNIRVEVRHFPMTNDQKKKEDQWNKISHEISQELDSGLTVGFLTLGDPNTYSTFSYISQRLKEKYEVGSIAGITSFNQMAAILNEPLVLDDEAYCVVPATASREVIERSLEIFSTIIIMKIANHLEKVEELLLKYNLKNKAIIISNASMSHQRIIKELDEIKEGEKLSYFSTMIIKK